MLAEINLGLNSLKTAADILKALQAGASETALNAVKLELQGHIFSAQDALRSARESEAAALERVKDLEQEIVRLKDWEAERQRYELKEVVLGVFAYAQKFGMENPQPAHRLCANCFDQGQRSILQRRPRPEGLSVDLVCARCGSELRVIGDMVKYLPTGRPEGV